MQPTFYSELSKDASLWRIAETAKGLAAMADLVATDRAGVPAWVQNFKRLMVLPRRTGPDVSMRFGLKLGVFSDWANLPHDSSAQVGRL